MKVCIHCQIEKPLEAFGKRALSPDGLHVYCRGCANAMEKARRAKDPERENALARAEYHKNKGPRLACMRERMKQPERAAKKRAQVKAWLDANPGKTAAYSAKHYRKDPEARKEAARARYTANSEKERARMMKNQRENLDVYAANEGKRRAAKNRATPAWLTQIDYEMMAVSYAMAKEMSDRFGYKFHVDHIAPLKGENICGLHVPLNLQVIPASVNISKSNKYRED